MPEYNALIDYATVNGLGNTPFDEVIKQYEEEFNHCLQERWANDDSFPCNDYKWPQNLRSRTILDLY